MQFKKPGKFVALSRLAGGFALAAFYFRRIASGIPGGQAFSEPERKRFRHYYYGVNFLAVLFSTVLGRSLTFPEREALGQLAALAALFDDLAEQAVPENMNSPAILAPNTEASGRLHKLLDQVLRRVPRCNRALFDSLQYEITILETETSPPFEFSALESHAHARGGKSVLLFRCLLDSPVSDREQEIWMQTGAFVQLCDDIFDLWFDRSKQIPTLARMLAEEAGANALNHYFSGAFRRTLGAADLLDVSKQHELKSLMACLAALAGVSLNRYVKLEITMGKLPADNRKMMVTDMALWSNRLAFLRALLHLDNT